MKRREFLKISAIGLVMAPFKSWARGGNMLIHEAQTRGHANHGWLKSWHTFSFANYYDPSRMNFGALRVINDDSIDGGTGFGTHPHRDMEIISVPLEGGLLHRDSEGNSYEIRKGEIQVMSAGTGIAHSEYNSSKENPAKFLQIWVMPKKLGIKPRYDQKSFDLKMNELKLIVSPNAQEESLPINQDAYFTLGKFEQSKKFQYQVKDKRNGVYIFIIDGTLRINNHLLKTRDGVGLTEVSDIKFETESSVELLIMEVPMFQ